MITSPPAPLDEAGLRTWGARVGASIVLPAVVTLRGELGAGKTTLAQAIAHGAGVLQEVTSPTFALVHEYESARGPLAHLDLYRLPSPDDLYALGWDDLLRTAALVIVEWPERAGALLPRRRYDLTLHEPRDDPSHRRVEVVWTD